MLGLPRRCPLCPAPAPRRLRYLVSVLMLLGFVDGWFLVESTGVTFGLRLFGIGVAIAAWFWLLREQNRDECRGEIQKHLS